MKKKLLENPEFLNLGKEIRANKSLCIDVSLDITKVVFISLLSKYCKNVFIISESIKIGQFLENIQTLSFSDSLEFPSWETLPFEKIPPSPDILGSRYQTLFSLNNEKEDKVIISNLQAVLQMLLPKDTFDKSCINLKVNEKQSFSSLQTKLFEMGYERKNLVSDKGEFAVRGGIFDVFAIDQPEPFRIEFFDNDIESIRTFDPIGQKSIENRKSVRLFLAKELELIRKSKALSDITEYLPKDTLIVLDHPKTLENKYLELKSFSEDKIPFFLSFDELQNKLSSFQKVIFESDKGSFNHSITTLKESFYTKDIIEKKEDYSFVHTLPVCSKSDYTFYFLFSSDAEETHLRELFANESLTLPKDSHFIEGYLSGGFVINSQKLAVVPYTEISKRYKIRRQKQRGTYHTTPVAPFELIEGDFVVHVHHGIGKYLGFERKKNHLGIEVEFLVIEYLENARLFVPLDQAHLISKYVGAKGEEPKLHKIGSSKWIKTKAQTERAIHDYASELLELYAKRQIAKGFAFPKDDEEMFKFEREFPYRETEDQLSAIEAIKEDMSSSRPMDRLICGDVGYGKTEVALRAAFKAVVEGGKQVAVLVPTTVLAMQHFETFIQRMQDFPINIAHLSRFITLKKSKEIVKSVSTGGVDILIGTHRIIGKDIHFKDLGLVVIDEEQRFGVKAKEHLKKIKVGVDCLTLSATPIPRTLYMSLVGVRDLSVINTPPQDRVPIKTIVCEFDDETIKLALQRELARGGQAFVIHNRVQSIHTIETKISKLVKGAKIVVGHGQMSSDELDLVFHAFKRGDAQIFIGTTILENGIDIPNANTIIIDRADQFGLADLYQLRGRVGRWNRRAYAYLLTPKGKIVREVSQKRLNALLESGGYGGGMKIAMRDLEIRGGGEILGVEQSGHVSNVGFHLYCKLLKQTILVLQGKAPRMFLETKVEFSCDARIPEDYINATELRMEIYQRLGDALKLEELDTILLEVKDRFGPHPKQLIWLYYVTRLRLFASLNRILFIKEENTKLIIKQRLKGKVIEKSFPFKPQSDPKEFEKRVKKKLLENFSVRVEL